MNYRQQIHNKIVEQVQAASFHPVSHTAGRVLSVDEATEVSPRAIEVQESGKSFGPSTRRDKMRQEIDSWDWDLVIEFNREVITESFEQAWMSQIPIIDKTDDTRVIFLYLESADYSHPERKNSPKGTYAAYRIRAEVGPQ